ncbi:sensor histidine kinase [Nocardiopsis salina]|uniref:sensor histidine kinase n=1 Tax=Nocardiopsis salina TaxID=245836 RepID=UPI00034D0BE5|nr:ATP-binding protein [Nocardiopsis salina]
MSDKIPRDRGAPSSRSTEPLWFLLPVPALLLWTWVFWEAPADLTAPVLAAGGATVVLLTVCAALLARRARKVRELDGRVDAVFDQAATLAERDLPRVITRLREGESAERVLHTLSRSEYPAWQPVLDLVVSEISRAERRRAATVSACATAAGRIQAMTTTMLADLRRMQDSHGDGTAGADVLGDLMHLDHTVARTGRTADSIAVLTGARSGRRWSRAIPMESIARGAMSRIGGYQRVRLHHVPDQAIAGFAAEGIIHALAEVLDNAAKFSPPTSEVHVHVEEVQAGLAVMVEDGGLVMGEEALGRARETVARGADIGEISGTRLGLSVVGLIAHRYELSVSFRPSSRGGTAVVVLLPRTLVKPLATGPTTGGAPASGLPPSPGRGSAPGAAPARGNSPGTGPVPGQGTPPVQGAGSPSPGQGTPPARGTASVPPEPAPAAQVPPTGSPAPGPAPADRPATEDRDTPPRHSSGLPMRRRGQTLAATQRPEPGPATSGPATSSQGFGAFRSAVRGQGPTGTPKDG